ncbi:MAG: glycosyltransferase family 1 protein [Betaproteobacteria bacterium]|nr:MAG: glycosyltransferase family 1 protein [Betaproteobacteria bacterium]
MPDRPGTHFFLEVHPTIPPRLARLEELATNLWYTWDRPTRSLFGWLHPGLWDAVGHSPKAFLRRIDEKRLVDAAVDPAFLTAFDGVIAAYDSYHGEARSEESKTSLGQNDLVAYFCAEFGFHESLPLYAGGLGILAGDHCKAASDLHLPFVAVGLLYRQGYFSQTIDGEGKQLAVYTDSDFEDLPIAPVRRQDGGELQVALELAGRKVQVKVWEARVGHVTLFLLDTDVPANRAADRHITYRLYGGDRNTRLEQEIVLGVGGVRALAAMGLKPTVWHMNEGHAAFLVLERLRTIMRTGVDLDSALEAVASDTVFTTHTAVEAGHDRFSRETIERYFGDMLREFSLSPEALCALGATPDGDEFDMTALAVRGSGYHNGVSRVHRDVTAQMLRELWPQIPVDEKPVGYVTNGVHTSTFLSSQMKALFDHYVDPAWTRGLTEQQWRDGVERIPDELFWGARRNLKTALLQLVRARIRLQHARNQGSETHLDRLFKFVDPDNPNVLTIGFARRFAQYKRAMLLFDNPDWLREIVSDRDKPVVFIFAGKAHPADVPGQELIRRVHEATRMPALEGKILLVEGYDLHLSRRLVAGVDVWLNNPVYPLEACGTSGMKAAMNGAINLSVLDGWWAEGYEGDNGWAIRPESLVLDEHRRDHEEAHTLYEFLQDQVLPLYYAKGDADYSPGWTRMAKRSIASIMPRFRAVRMVGEYVTKFYLPASQQGRALAEQQFAPAARIAAWKARVRAAWPQVSLRRLDTPKQRIGFGQNIAVEVGAKLDGLAPEDVVVELLMTRLEHDSGEERVIRYPLASTGKLDGAGEHVFRLDVAPELCGKLDYRIRAYPRPEALMHPFEMGLMVWV